VTTPPGGPAVGVTASGWHRLHPLTPIVRAGRIVVVLALGLLASARHSGGTAFLVDGGVLALVLVLSFVNWTVTRWRIDDGALRIESGLLRRTSRRFPPEQLQAVDTVRPALARVFGLAEIRLRMGASTGSSGRLSYLSDAEAEGLRARLLALAHGVAEHTPAPPEQPLFTVPTGQLIASMLTSSAGLFVEAVIVVVVILAVLVPSVIGPVIGVGATFLIGIGTNFLRRVNGEFELTVAEAPDGLRVRSGLLQTSAETIPRGRVQAVRMLEPLLWRQLGWCRLVLEVAGKQRGSRENQSVGGSQRVVLPVGSQAQAAWLLQRILPGAPPPGSPPPRRAWAKSPLRFRFLSWRYDDTYAVSTSGRVCRVTDWVPLAKAQSIRRSQGPLQRHLHLATVHIDTAGRNIRAAGRDRDDAEAALLIDQLPAAARAARLAGQAQR
jgi:putative membrane protein